MEFLLQIIQGFNEYAKTNPIVAGAVSLWGLAVVTWLFRNIPTTIGQFVKRQCTTSLSFTSSGIGTNMETFSNFLMWFEKNRWARFSRSLSLTGSWKYDSKNYNDENGTVIGIGDGRHFFMYRGRPYWMSRSRLQEGTGFQITYEIRITGLGRSRDRILSLIDEFRYKPVSSKFGVYIMNGTEWLRLADVNKRPLDTVVIDRTIKDQIVANIQYWMDNRSWYEDRGLPYKLTFVLKGLPGTGKTSLIKAIASHFQMNVCLINLAMMTDVGLERALSSAPYNSVIIIEDFDSTSASKARRALVSKQESEKSTQPSVPTSSTEVPAPVTAKNELTAASSLQDLLPSCLTLSGLLNALDGILSLDGKLVFMTTNVYETLDPALVRKGRVDHTYELGKLTDREVREYIQLMFPDYSLDPAVWFEPILGCDLQGLYFDHRFNAQDFVDSIPKKFNTPTQLMTDREVWDHRLTVAGREDERRIAEGAS